MVRELPSAWQMSTKEALMSYQPAACCAKCNLRIAPYDLRTVYHGTDYHQDCFLRLVREEANEQKRRREFSRLARKETGGHTNHLGR